MAVINQYDPGRWKRFGYAGPFYDPTAQVLGVATILHGLFPLGFFARSGKQAGHFCSVVGVLLMLTVTIGFKLVK